MKHTFSIFSTDAAKSTAIHRQTGLAMRDVDRHCTVIDHPYSWGFSLLDAIFTF
jgi:hypothetical protein